MRESTVRQPFESLLSRLIITNIATQRIAELFLALRQPWESVRIWA
jgi:hypothetical protein